MKKNRAPKTEYPVGARPDRMVVSIKEGDRMEREGKMEYKRHGPFEYTEAIFRFKFQFMDCKSYKAIYERLRETKEYFKKCEKTGAKLHNEGDDYFLVKWKRNWGPLGGFKKAVRDWKAGK